MRDKIAGAIYGMALGDAMGLPSELWGREKVRKYFGKIEGLLDGPKENSVACNYKKGQLSKRVTSSLSRTPGGFKIFQWQAYVKA